MKGEKQNRTVQQHFWMSKKENSKFEIVCQKLGLSYSSTIRFLICREYDNILLSSANKPSQ